MPADELCFSADGIVLKPISLRPPAHAVRSLAVIAGLRLRETMGRQYTCESQRFLSRDSARRQGDHP